MDYIFNCVFFQYLGSTLVKELHGLESTKMSIQKLKASTKDIGKIPSIILSISYSGVKFINAENQVGLQSHSIKLNKFLRAVLFIKFLPLYECYVPYLNSCTLMCCFFLSMILSYSKILIGITCFAKVRPMYYFL